MAEGQTMLEIGTQVSGTVRHLGVYGALIDIGTGQDALLHVSQMAQGEEAKGDDAVQAGAEITAYVYRRRRDGHVALSFEKPPDVPWQSIKQGNRYTGHVIRIENFGGFVDFGAERPGMVHVSEMAEGYVKSPGDIASVGQEVEVRVIKKSGRPRKIDLSMKPAEDDLAAQAADDDIEVPTTMAQAFQRAMDGGGSRMNRGDRQRDRSNSHRARQEEIMARTLRGSGD